ncbi:MAG: Arm DNA-binding domain-containing protein [Bacillus sp. (in: Bacteria)]|nr:Arm DNA-binding domain-containing protein [Bacillus sp. (in: firmicutes)]
MPIYPYTKNGKEHYYYAFEVKDKITGKRKTIKQRGFKGKTEARRAEEKARVAWEKGEYVEPSKLTYSQYALGWEQLRRKQV